MSTSNSEQVVVEREHLDDLLVALQKAGYTVVGPTVRDGAIVYDTLTSIDDLPQGWTDQQEGGKYRLVPRTDHRLFGYVVGAHSWKKHLLPPALRLWQAKRTKGGFQINESKEEFPTYAFFGVRSCDLHAIAAQDKIFMNGAGGDPDYQQRRKRIFVVAVNCSQAGGTCFCASMNTGPKATSGFDLALTEVQNSDSHHFVVEIGTTSGEEILKQVPNHPATRDDVEIAERIVKKCADEMGRRLDTTDLKNLLYTNAEHPRWEAVAARCLSCANCTMVCPTCFCTTVEDVTDLTGAQAERWRKWDSCFTMDFSYIHGGSVRQSTRARYRQWLTHKLAAWHDQFGASGCVGGGRCITWCPVGIDLTEEVRLLREGRRPASA
jgi:ferredoxin